MYLWFFVLKIRTVHYAGTVVQLSKVCCNASFISSHSVTTSPFSQQEILLTTSLAYNKVEIIDIDDDVMSQLLHFIYTG